MKVANKPYQSIWYEPDTATVNVIDQRWLPHRFQIEQLDTCKQAFIAIRDMWVRGAPLIGATAAYGIALQMREDASDEALSAACSQLASARPTAVNLTWALDRLRKRLEKMDVEQRADHALSHAQELCIDDVRTNESIGQHGLALIRAVQQAKNGDTVNILTHCNAGWLATVDRGTATAPIYAAVEAGISLHVWVDETRPRSQGSKLTAWELAELGIAHTLIVDNAAGYLMRKRKVDMVLVGTDRTLVTGAVCNKIGTYQVALAAKDNDVPFYVAAPSSSIDWTPDQRDDDIPIEQRAESEVLWLSGVDASGVEQAVRISPQTSSAFNPAFDVTPARLVTGIITERGVSVPDPAALCTLFPDLCNQGRH